jgi:L-2-hydroxyglutarate oxidase
VTGRGVGSPSDGADVVVVGGGIVGLASAYKLLQARPGGSVIVLEKEARLGQHQSGHNSGVLHAGLSYAPGSAKARLAVDGVRQMTAFCRRFQIPHELCGKLVIASDVAELPALRALEDRGTRNGLTGLEWLDGGQIAEVEPHAAGVAALRVPQEGIVDYGAVCRTLAVEIERLGGRIRTGWRVRSLRRPGGTWRLESESGSVMAEMVVNCAGLHADRLAAMAGAPSSLRIVPFRGRYYRLRANRQFLVRHLIYPVPNPAFPFLGVHLTRRIEGAVDAGPNAMLALAREGYDGRDVSARDAAELVTFPGLWRFLARHRQLVARELALTLGRGAFTRALQRLVPQIRPADLVPAGAGVRAQAMTPDGQLVADFVFATSDMAVHLLNAPSPGATAALAIGDEVVRRVLELKPDQARRQLA